MFPRVSVAGGAQQSVGRSRSASLVPSERMMPSMNDNDKLNRVRGPSALNARPANGTRIALPGVVRRGAPSNPRSSSAARAARSCPCDVVETLRVSSPSRGAAQLASRWAPTLRLLANG